MTLKEKAQRKAVEATLRPLIKYAKKDPVTNLPKLVNFAETVIGKLFPSKYMANIKAGASNPENTWNKLATRMLSEIDEDTLVKMSLAFGLGAGVHGTKAVRENRETKDCNIPWVILISPTSACNLKCKGCWAAQYDKKQDLTNDEIENIISQGLELGTHFYMFTGGEPLVRKNDIINICANHPDCIFLTFTNGTLIDEEFCRKVKEVGNLAFAISVEGDEASNDARRGDGTYKRVMNAMQLMKKNGLLFGMSVCYTSQNVEKVTSDEFIDKMIDAGAKYGWYFNYMPVGVNAVPELIPNPEQRKHMYSWLRKMRKTVGGKPIFVIDFQDDGEYVGGCIAAGRNFFHINSAGDIEPCVFVHYSDSNIRTHTLLQALQNPLFQAYYHGQPFNDNHLRPCPMLENPEKLREIIKKTSAKSTDLEAPEDVDCLCGKCEYFANAWKEEAQKLWESTEHPNPKTQYYRDKKIQKNKM